MSFPSLLQVNSIYSESDESCVSDKQRDEPENAQEKIDHAADMSHSKLFSRHRQNSTS